MLPALMQQLFDAIFSGLESADGDAQRLFHGRGHCYEGLEYLTVDWFEPVLLITLFREPPQAVEWEQLLSRLKSELPEQVAALVVQHRYEKGTPLEVVRGELPEELVAHEDGLRYQLTLKDRQNIGFFLDMRPGRRWLRERAEGKRVLNLFAYTCSFSVAAIAGGAERVFNLDMARSSLDQGKQNHRLNDQGQSMIQDVLFFCGNLFKSWGRLSKFAPYDRVIIDPPTRQKGSFVAEKDYAKVLRRLPKFLASEAEVLVCLNAPHLGEQWIRDLVAAEWPQAELVGRIAGREDLPEQDSDCNLKLMHYRFPVKEPVQPEASESSR